jgi:charged multivesicular body protein 2A
MGNLLGGKPKDVKEIMRENERMINRAVRQLERERRSQEKDQAKVVAEIKKNAKNGQVSAAKALAKQYVRSKQFINKFVMMETQLKGIALQMQTIKSTHAMGEAMKGVASAMQKVNKQFNLPELNKIMSDFMRENDIQETMQDTMSDALDDALMQDGTEDEEANILNQVMDELGLEFAAKLPGTAQGATPMGAKAAPEATLPMAMGGGGGASVGGGEAGGAGLPPPGGDVSISDIEERLKNLKK